MGDVDNLIQWTGANSHNYFEVKKWSKDNTEKYFIYTLSSC